MRAAICTSAVYQVAISEPIVSGLYKESTLPILTSRLDTQSEGFQANLSASLAELAHLDELAAQAISAGGERYISRHRERGKLLPRERIEMLIDPDSAFLELSPFAAWGTRFAIGATVVTGLGVVSNVECVVIAHDPTVRGGTGNPYTVRKFLRAIEIARTNRLPLIWLVESGGADLPTQSDIFVPAGAQFQQMTQMSAHGVPVISLVFGNSTAGGAYLPGMSDYVVMVKERAKVFLGGPPLVKMATGEESDDESLGGAEMHARTSGLADYLATDEADCLRIGRQIIADLNWKKLGPAPDQQSRPPLLDPEELLGISSPNLKQPLDIREVIGRLVDGSEFDEFKPLYGLNLVTGWAHLHGYRLGILGNNNGIIFSEEAKKATQFIELANQSNTPLIFLQNTTGFMVGKRYEQGGIIKDGALMINAVANSTVPHFTVNVGGSYGAGNYGMCGRSFQPRFLFSWPHSRTAVMGPEQLAGVLSIVRRQAATNSGRAFDEEEDRQQRAAVETQIEDESKALFMSGKLYDDGIIDPRDTRTVLAIAVSAAHSAAVQGARGYGVFRV
jgi:acetyl-CoA carboxylase carboxyltransferase component